MAFDFQTLDMTGVGLGGGPKYGTYDAGADNIAAVETDGYFDGADRELSTGDILVVKASDATRVYSLTVTAGDVALGPAPNACVDPTAIVAATPNDTATLIVSVNELKADFNTLRTNMLASGLMI